MADSLDDSVERWLDTHRSQRWRLDADGAFSYLGRPLHVAAAGAVAGTLLSIRARSVIRGALVMGGVAVGVVLEQTFKAVIGRTPRPWRPCTTVHWCDTPTRSPRGMSPGRHSARHDRGASAPDAAGL